MSRGTYGTRDATGLGARLVAPAPRPAPQPVARVGCGPSPARLALQVEMGARIRERRLALGLTQEQLAAKVRERDQFCTADYVSNLEGGRATIPRSDRLGALARALDMTADALLGIAET